MCIYMHNCMCLLMHACMRAGFKNRKVIRNFCKMATHFGIVTRNYKSLFATFLHFCIIHCKKKVFRNTFNTTLNTTFSVLKH